MYFLKKYILNFLSHLIHPLLGNRNQYNTQKHKVLYPINFIIWLILIPFKILEIIGFSYLLNFIFKSFSKTRTLTNYEIQELQLVFKNSIDYSKVRINETSKWAKIGSKSTKSKHLGFVWMQTINFTRVIDCENNLNDIEWLVHEMVHISQFKTLGIQYIFEALIAQHIGGYNYGGQSELQNNKPLNYYNLEQQADILKHHYRALKHKNEDTIFQKFSIDLMDKKF